MRPFETTNNTADLLLSLTELRPTLFPSRFFRRDTREEILFEKIATHDELCTVPILANFLNAPEPTREFAATAIEKIMAGRGIEQLSRLDVHCRKHTEHVSTTRNWNSMQVSDLFQFNSRNMILGLFSFHPNGWVRQAAVDRIAISDFEAAMPFLLLRVNDWVIPVRTRALEAVQTRLHNGQLGPLISYLPLVSRFKEKRRSDLSELQVQFEQALLTSSNHLEDALTSTNFRVRRFAFGIVWQGNHRDVERIVQMALNDDDPLVRIGAAKLVSAQAIATNKIAKLKPLLDDRWYAVRLIATRALIALDKPDQIRPMLSDRVLSVRDAARFYFRSNTKVFDNSIFVKWYRSELKHGNLLVGLLGLGEIGSLHDLDLIEPHLHDQSPRIVEAALRAYSLLTDGTHAVVFTSYLSDHHPRVSRAAMRGLEGDVSKRSIEEYTLLLYGVQFPAHARINAYRLLLRQGKWPRLIVLLTVLNHPDNPAHKLAQSGIVIWGAGFNRSYTTPTSIEIEQISRLVKTASLRESQKHDLESLVRSF